MATTSQHIQTSDGSTAGAMALANTATAARTTLDMSLDKAWASLELAYSTLGIALTDHDVKLHRIGNSSFRARRKVGDVMLGKALNCGGETSAPNAESYDLTLSVQSNLTMEGNNRVLLQTLVEGVGKNPLTNNSNQVTCYSMGVFEKRIADLVNQKAAFMK